MWDVALLLKSADQTLPDPVMKVLEQQTASPAVNIEPKSSR
jgi:hypothetical protein